MDLIGQLLTDIHSSIDRLAEDLSRDRPDLAAALRKEAALIPRPEITPSPPAPPPRAPAARLGPLLYRALDEGILPHQRSFDDPEAMHEERRLMYVGMTRAKDRLYLVRAFRRSIYGDSGPSEASRFLDDIPERLLKGNLARKQAKAEAYFQKATRWDGGSTAAPRASRPAVSAATRYKSGQRVKHKLFGEGIVIDSHVRGDDEEVDVAFEDVGLKRLVASIANLELLKG